MSGRRDGDETDAVTGDESRSTAGSTGAGASGADGDRPPTGSAWARLDAVRDRIASVGTARVVFGITAVALLVRLAALGARPMHFDEARVGYWVLHYLDTGSFHYRPVIHGPFVQIVDAWLFRLFGPSDFLVRLPVAVIGGLLPLSALLFREHLRKHELVALALFLAFNPFFLYYSRYMRSDMLLATFSFAALGLFVRYYDARSIRSLYGGVLLLALAFTTKENAILYVLTWIGAAALLADQALFRPRDAATGLDVLKQSWVGRTVAVFAALVLSVVRGRGELSRRIDRPRRLGRRIAQYAGHTLVLALLFLAVLVFFYADRGAGIAGIRQPPVASSAGALGLWEALGRPLQFPGFALDTLSHAATAAADQWGSVESGEDSFLIGYASTLGETLLSLATGALVLSVAALLGLVAERYGSRRSRNFVLFMGYCGLASLFGYSLKNDPGTGYWLTIHVILPLAVPAAVGVGWLYRQWRAATVDRDALATVVTVGLLVLIAVQPAAVAASTSFGDTTSAENDISQYAQAEADARVAYDAIGIVSDGPVSAGSNGTETDVLVYTGGGHEGNSLVGNPIGEGDLLTRPLCIGTGWYDALPLPWYLSRANATVDCLRDSAALRSTVAETPPPMIVTNGDDSSVPTETLAEQYSARTFQQYKYDHPVTFYVHEDWVDRVPGWPPEE